MNKNSEIFRQARRDFAVGMRAFGDLFHSLLLLSFEKNIHFKDDFQILKSEHNKIEENLWDLIQTFEISLTASDGDSQPLVN